MITRPLNEIRPILETFFEYKYHPNENLSPDEEEWLEILHINQWTWEQLKVFVNVQANDKGFTPKIYSAVPGYSAWTDENETYFKTPLEATRAGIDVLYGSILHLKVKGKL